MAEKGQIYSYSTFDLAKTSDIRTGLATVLKTMGPVYLLGYMNAGVSTSATGSTTQTLGGSFALGGIGVLKFKNGITLEAGCRSVKDSGGKAHMVFELGWGFAR